MRVWPLLEGGQIHIEFRIINVGTFAAAVTAVEATLSVHNAREVGQLDSRVWTAAIPMPKQIIDAGDSVIVSAPTSIIYKKWNTGPGQWWRPLNNLVVSGIITYTDDAKIMRRTGFYRVSTDDTNRFVRVDNSAVEADHEYED